MSKFSEGKYKDVHDRFVEEAYRENPNIKDFEDFTKALNNYLGINKKGQILMGKVMEDSDYKMLFQSQKNQELILRNIDEDEYNEQFEPTDDEVVGDAEFDVIKKKSGEPIKPRDVVIVYTPKIVTIKQYSTKQGESRTSYSKSVVGKYNSREAKFIKSLKGKKLSVRQVVTEYNKEFSGKQRTFKAIRSKYYRTG